MKNVGNATPKALLKAAGKNTFKYLHENFGFDFEKPFILEEGENNFTINKVWSIIPHCNYDYTVAVVVSGYTPYYYCVQILSNDFSIELPNKNVLKWKTRPETYYRKSDFNRDRKKALEYFIIAQKKEYCLPIVETRYGNYTFLENVRYTNVVKNGSYGITFSEPNQGEKTYFSVGNYIYGKSDDIKNNPVNWFDKSGYLTYYKREELKRKAKKIREERQKAKYLETDNTSYIEKVRYEFNKLKTYSIGLLAATNNYETLKNISRCFEWKVTWILFEIELFEQRTNNKEYASIENSMTAYNNILEKIQKAYEELNGKEGTEK